MTTVKMLGTTAARRPGATGTRAGRIKPRHAGRYRHAQRARERRTWQREWR